MTHGEAIAGFRCTNKEEVYINRNEGIRHINMNAKQWSVDRESTEFGNRRWSMRIIAINVAVIVVDSVSLFQAQRRSMASRYIELSYPATATFVCGLLKT